MKKISFWLSLIALSLGLSGSGLLFVYGLPSKIKSPGGRAIITSQPHPDSEQIIRKNQKITWRAHAGIGLVGLCFLIQGIVVIIERPKSKKKNHIPGESS